MKTEKLEKFETYYHDKIGMCGCGDPKSIKNLLYNLLVNHKKYNEGSITYEIRDKNKADIIKKTDPDTLVDFIFMALDNAGIIDHGGYIGNGWITEEGKEFLGLLKEFKDED